MVNAIGDDGRRRPVDIGGDKTRDGDHRVDIGVNMLVLNVFDALALSSVMIEKGGCRVAMFPGDANELVTQFRQNLKEGRGMGDHMTGADLAG